MVARLPMVTKLSITCDVIVYLHFIFKHKFLLPQSIKHNPFIFLTFIAVLQQCRFKRDQKDI